MEKSIDDYQSAFDLLFKCAVKTSLLALTNMKYKDLLAAKDNGYSFFWESIFILSKKKYLIHEIPIILPNRSFGSSKMKIKDIINALIYIFIISMNKSKY